MDPRLKKILDESEIKREKQAKEAAKLQAEAERVAKEKLEKQKVAAAQWVDDNIFNLIEKAESVDSYFVELDDGKLFGSAHDYKGIPVKLLAEAAAKIDGLTVETVFKHGYSDNDVGHERDRDVYYVYWGKQPPKMRNTYW